MTQTAVECLLDELYKKGYYYNTDEDFYKIVNTYKQMEKEQIEQAIDACRHNYKHSDNYYNETYGSKGSDVMTPENHIGVLSEAVKHETTSSQTDISKENQKGILVELMELDAKDGLYRTEISDEEIEKQSNKVSEVESLLVQSFAQHYFELGARWYREQLKSKPTS